MRICIVRNAEAESNAGILRIVDALAEKYDLLTLTRSRTVNKEKGIIEKSFYYKEFKIINYEIQISSEMGQGIKNIAALISYQYILFRWFLSNKSEFDVLHIFDLDAGLPAILANIFMKKKIVYHIADFYVDSRSGIPKNIQKYIIKMEHYVISKANVTIICTEERKEQIKGSRPHMLEVIHNSPVETTIRKSNNNLDNKKKFQLCYVGGLSKLRFINEILEVAKDNPDIVLKIAGFGNLQEKVEIYAEKYSNIIFLGRIKYQEAIELYRSSDLIFAMYDPSHPNHKYSAPNKVYEAMMLNKAIIVAKGTSVDKIVEQEGIGLAVDYDKKSFETVLRDLINDKDLRKWFQDNTIDAYEQYSWEKMRVKVQNIYVKL